MSYETLKKVAVLCGFGMAMLCLALNLWRGADLLHAAFSAFWVMLTVSLALLGVSRLVIAVLLNFLQQQSEEVKKRERRLPPAKPAA